MKRYLLPLLFLTETCFALSGIGTSYIRLEPSTVPTQCRIGDIRTNTATNNLMVCTATNTWNNILTAALVPLPVSVTNGGTGANLSATGGTSQVLKQTTVGGAVSVARLACSDLSNSVASCSTDTTNAANITAGTLSNSQLPNPILLQAGTIGAPSLSFSGDATNGLYHVGANNWDLVAGGAQAIDLIKSTGGYANIGLGGSASTSDYYPLLILRTIPSTIQAQISNGNTGAGSGSRLQVLSDAGNNSMEISSFTAATAAPDIYAGGRGVVRASGSLSGLTLVADNGAGADVRIYAGDGIANRIATANSSGFTLGVAGSLTGMLNLAGLTSGTITLQSQAAAGTYNFNMPTTAGSAGSVLTSQGGGTAAMTWTTPLVNPMTTGGDLIVGGAAGAATRLANGTVGQVFQSAGGTAAPAWQTLPGNATALKAITVQKFLSGSGTYTTPTGPAPLYIKVRMVGGGGGGGGGGTAATGAGGTGGNTTFGTTLLSANGGTGGGGGPSTSGGAGGPASLGTGPIGLAFSGASGNAGSSTNTATNYPGGAGANSAFGGGGGATTGGNGPAGATNTGGGGSGGGTGGTASSYPGAGGGAGGFVDAIITSPLATYAYAVGAAGASGGAGTSGNPGGAGGSGVIIVEEYYQ